MDDVRALTVDEYAALVKLVHEGKLQKAVF